MNAELEKALCGYRTENLFLLVGENPLPNYVAARLLLKDGGCLYLVHSPGSGEIAQRLARHLQIPNTCTIEVDEFDAEELGGKIAGYLGKTCPGRMGLNYTGATKFMAVHTYRTMDKFCGQGQIVLSYLHADTLELSIEPCPGVPGLKRRVVDAVPLSFKDILALHGVKLTREVQTEPLFPDLARALAQMHDSNGSAKAWGQGAKHLLASDGLPWRDVRVELLDLGVSQEVVDELALAFELEPDELLDLEDAAERNGCGNPKDWLKWEWLEDWTLACAQALDYAPRVKDLRGTTSGKQEFQIDVAVMRGYQLFVLSCKATANRRYAKLGLMEAFARARQMGGEEARAALVTTYHDPDALAQEFATDWGASKRVRVFGCTHLADLQNELKVWFENP